MQPIHASQKQSLPDWALRQRHLIDTMDAAAPAFQARYTRANGTLNWRDEWPEMDGSDEGYESYHNWPLFYGLGGSADIHERSRFLWDAVTRQFTAYGQVYQEFDAYYDWMHHGESSIYFYHFGLADPKRPVDRARALRFADLYAGDDALNRNAAQRMKRSPINGSRGPRHENSWDDWSTHGENLPIADRTDDAVYVKILDALNTRQMRCDVPLNLTSTSLITNAYMYTGDEGYRNWVVGYLEMWAERIQANDGICDDGDPQEWDVHHWQEINPVRTEALVQLTCGGPPTVYHGGLLHTRLRYYDAGARRPGLPEDVSALVSHLDDDSVTVSLVNGSPLHERRVILQAGAFGEHRFTSMAEFCGETIHAVGDRYIEVTLPPGRSIDGRCGMDRYAHRPSYDQPI